MASPSHRADLAEEAGVEARQLRGHVLLVHVVELMERSSGGEAALHQVQHRHHTCTNMERPSLDRKYRARGRDEVEGIFPTDGYETTSCRYMCPAS